MSKTDPLSSFLSNDPDASDLCRQARLALRRSNARTFDGNDNFKKCLVLTTCVVGGDDGPVFDFEATVPRSAVNDLFISRSWGTDSRESAAQFLRALAEEIERGEDDDDDLDDDDLDLDDDDLVDDDE